MQHETHSHGINMSALGRDKQSLSLAEETVAIEVPGLSLYYGEKQALFDVSMNIPKQRVTAFIGPSGCGKSTLLRTFNRMNDLVDGCRVAMGRTIFHSVSALVAPSAREPSRTVRGIRARPSISKTVKDRCLMYPAQAKLRWISEATTRRTYPHTP